MIESINNVITRIQRIKKRIDFFYSLSGSNSYSFEKILQKTRDSHKETKGEESRILGIIEKYSKKYGLSPALIKAVVKAESNFDPKAISRAGAMGLMQLMPHTAKELGVSNPFDPDENIDGGTRYLKGLLDMFNNNLELALAAYNAGPERVRRAGGVPKIEETQRYIEKVLKFYEDFS
jgi:soluble lytic murein transglycosylase-like protein